jgi:hypothetical protein
MFICGYGFEKRALLSEIRSPKSEGNPNDQMSEGRRRREYRQLWVIGLGIWDLIRISDFGFRASGTGFRACAAFRQAPIH